MFEIDISQIAIIKVGSGVGSGSGSDRIPSTGGCTDSFCKEAFLLVFGVANTLCPCQKRKYCRYSYDCHTTVALFHWTKFFILLKIEMKLVGTGYGSKGSKIESELTYLLLNSRKPVTYKIKFLHLFRYSNMLASQTCGYTGSRLIETIVWLGRKTDRECTYPILKRAFNFCDHIPVISKIKQNFLVMGPFINSRYPCISSRIILSTYFIIFSTI
jgi:hypothetical protein